MPWPRLVDRTSSGWPRSSATSNAKCPGGHPALIYQEEAKSCRLLTSVASSGSISAGPAVTPPGSTVATADAERAVTRQTDQGGAPTDGALNGAVGAVPDSSTSYGQPPSAQAAANRATVSRSVTTSAVPLTTRSNSWVCRSGPPAPGALLAAGLEPAGDRQPIEGRQLVEVREVLRVHAGTGQAPPPKLTGGHESPRGRRLWPRAWPRQVLGGHERLDLSGHDRGHTERWPVRPVIAVTPVCHGGRGARHAATGSLTVCSDRRRRISCRQLPNCLPTVPPTGIPERTRARGARGSFGSKIRNPGGRHGTRHHPGNHYKVSFRLAHALDTPLRLLYPDNALAIDSTPPRCCEDALPREVTVVSVDRSLFHARVRPGVQVHRLAARQGCSSA